MNIFSADIAIASAAVARQVWKTEAFAKPSQVVIMREGSNVIRVFPFETTEEKDFYLVNWDSTQEGGFFAVWEFGAHSAKQKFLFSASSTIAKNGGSAE